MEKIGKKSGPTTLYLPSLQEHISAPLSESETEQIESVLLPIGAGPHSALAAEAARAVARVAGASVTVIHAISPEATQKAISEAEDLLDFTE